jgi:hypothetical protein
VKSNISWFSPNPNQWEGLDYRYERFHFLIDHIDHYELGDTYVLVVENSHDITYGLTLGNFPSLAAAQHVAERFGLLLYDLTEPQTSHD